MKLKYLPYYITCAFAGALAPCTYQVTNNLLFSIIFSSLLLSITITIIAFIEDNKND
jgi:hypothetical protein